MPSALDGRVVARDRVADGRRDAERRGGLLRVLEVAERDAPAHRDQADVVAPGDDVAPALLVDHADAVVHREPRRRDRGVVGARRLARSESLRRAERVDDGERRGRRRAARASPSGLKSTPDDVIARSDVRSQRSGSASSASSSGRANTSPTMVRVCTCSRATASHTNAGSRPGRSTSTTVPPPASAASGANSPVPCMSGAAGSRVDARLPARAAANGSGGSGVRGCDRRPQRDVEVVVAPHHALGHAGGAAGVEEDQVVARRRAGCPLGAGRRRSRRRRS